MQVAQDRILGRTVVLKLADAGTSAADELRAEGRLLVALEHPDLVAIHDRFLDRPGLVPGERVTGFATSWVDGRSLTDAVRTAPLAARMQRFGQLVDVVAYLHQRGVLHLDLKPANTLASEKGVVLLDLGSARPLDAGPGEAGGTLGYAAPEVLAGQAATVAADVYSLGAILYELLVGRAPFGDLSAQELRRAALAGEVVPARAVAPDTPWELARLADAMLAADPIARPATLAAVQEALGAAGFCTDGRSGAPRFVGRQGLLGELGGWLREPPARVVTVVGPPGSGRRRLVRRALRQLEERPWVDLDQPADVVRALDGLAGLAGHELPSRAGLDVFGEALAVALGDWSGAAPVLHLGRRETCPPDLLRVLDAVAPRVAAAGFPVVWTGEAAAPGSSALTLSPLDAEAIAQLTGLGGARATRRARELLTRTGGWPGPLLRALSPAAAPQGGPGARALGVLPSGVPRAVVDALPQEWRAEIEARVAAGDARWGADGRLYGGGDADRDVSDIAGVLLAAIGAGGDGAQLPWRALAQARLGGDIPDDVQLDGLGGGLGRAGWRDLAERLAARGRRDAQLLLARLREEDGDLDGAIALLAALPSPSSAETLRRVAVLRRARRMVEAGALAREGLARQESAPLWLELARVHIEGRAFPEAEDAIARAEALDPDETDDLALALRIRLARLRLQAGQEVADLDGLLRRVEQRAEAGALAATTLSGAGRLLARIGELARGERMLAMAAGRADQEGDTARSAGIRLNRGNALQSLGQGRAARAVYQEALSIAERARLDDIRLRVRYSLGDLEIRAGRLPAAAMHVDAFVALAAESGVPEATHRATALLARLLEARGRPAEALERLDEMPAELPEELRTDCDIVRARALLALGRSQEVLPALAASPESPVPTRRALVEALRARALLAQARALLAQARAVVPDEPDPVLRLTSGEILLAAAGEDLDPDTLGARRSDLDRAARLLRGEPAGRAATLRDRLLDGPGANLEGIVELAEAMNHPEDFPGALARLVGQALGAHRVLIMLALPGMGRQVTYTELTGAEAAGIGTEVLRRIRRPDDHWLAHDAFADPQLRESSATVRTFELKSLLAVAIPRGDRAIGALYVDDLHRANRFGEADVAILQRLARAVGGMLPLLDAASRGPWTGEPRDVLGVLLTDPRRVEEIEQDVALLDGVRQANVLITGPTGAGKSVLARRLATEVLGATGVEVVVLRKGDPQWLITQLMGARRGEFTGAMDREGAIQRCLRHRRALFLDEVQNLDEAGQQILLPLLEMGQRHFGGLTGTSERLPGPLHVLLGTNADVSKGRWKDHFREDLWYRMNEAHIDLPPLADRGPEAVYCYLAQMLEAEGAPAPEVVFDPRALHRATRWGWPGNLRQLHVFAGRAAQLHRATGRPLGLEQLPRLGVDTEGPVSEDELDPGIDTVLKEHVLDVLGRNAWVQKEAATELGRSPAWLSKYLRRHGLVDEVKRLRRGVRGGR